MTNLRPIKLHRAGQKIKAWRTARNMTAEQFGSEVGQSAGACPKGWLSRTVYGWETRGKVPREGQVVLALERMGICAAVDWHTEALPESSATRAA